MEQPSNERPRTDKDRPKRSFNFYWIYGIIIVVILSINLFTMSGGMVEIEPTEYSGFVAAGDVDRVVVVNDQVAHVYIKKDSLNKAPHKDRIRSSMMGGANVAGPHYAFNIGSIDAFQEELKKDYAEQKVRYSFKQQENWGREILQWVLFVAIMVAI